MRDIDLIIEAVRREFPDAEVRQLQVAHPGVDDDGIWYFYLPGRGDDDIQIESSSGMCPFIVETNRTTQAREGKAVAEVSALICEHLATVGPSR